MWTLVGLFFISLTSSYMLAKTLIPFFKRNDIIALDLHKEGKPKVANSGGIPVALSLIAGLMFFIAAQTFIFNVTDHMIYLFASILTILLITVIGFFDDLNRNEVVNGKRTIRSGLGQWQKPIWTLAAAVPLMVVSAGVQEMYVPFIGSINFGIFYPLVLIPIGVVGAANAVNLLGGFNGSEAGMGIVYCTALGIYALMHNEIVSAAIFFATAASLLGFLAFNWPPAKMLSGDSLTYCLGAVVASGVIIGNMERAGVIALAPFFIELALKLRSRLKASCLGVLQKDGTIKAPSDEIYSWTHIIMKAGEFTEKQISMILILIQLVFSSFMFLI